jgi:exosortase
MSITELPPARTSRGRETPRPVLWAIAAGCLALAHLPLLVAHAQQIWLRPHYQFFPLVLVGAVVLLVVRVRHLGELTPAAAGHAALCFAAAGAVLAAAELLHSSWLGAVSAVLSSGAALFAAGGGRLLRAGAPALLLLCVAIPPPLELDRTLILALQSWTARWGSRVLDLLGVYHVLAGHVVETGGRRFFVEEACSGVNSLFSVFGCTLFFVFFHRRRPAHAALLLAAAVAWVLAANVARVVGVVYLGTVHGIDLADGWRHDALGYALLVVVLLLVVSTDQLLLFLTAPAAGGDAERAEEPAAAPTRWAGPAPHLAWLVTAAFCALLACHLALYGAGDLGGRPAASAGGLNPDELEAAALPERVGRWERRDFAATRRNPGSEFGEFSSAWVYQFGARRATVSLDYPFPSWHDLTRCYTSQGWVIDDEAVHAAPEGYVEVKLTKPAYRSGYLLFAEFDRGGTTLEPRRGGPLLSLYRHDSALQRLWGRAAGAAPPSDLPGPVLQLQLFVETHSALSADEEAEARAFFARARKELPPGAGGSGAARVKD